jgi:aspartate/tyrosine/aromatic aminotransferase
LRFSHALPNAVKASKNMFESTPINPPDAIFGLNEEFQRDPNPDKIDLTVGMYQNESGQIPIMQCVRQAEFDLWEQQVSHVYLPIDGLAEFNRWMPRLILGASHEAVSEQRVHAAQTPGGTGALRIAGELLVRIYGVRRLWASNPTWVNHLTIFPAAGLQVGEYGYLDDSRTQFDCQRMLDTIQQMQPREAILLHAVCHNPTGADPTRQQWEQILAAVKQRQLMPVFDFAYQGFGDGVEDDAFPIRHYCEQNSEAIICNSFSKNFNLYGERVGSITTVASNRQDAKAVLSQVKAVIRAIYSNPPMHGAAVVARVLNDESLSRSWRNELEANRLRIAALRQQFVDALSFRIPHQDFRYILRQRGMFSYSGICGEAVDRLKHDFGVYMLRSGRINVAGINANNIDRLCDAIAVVHQKTPQFLVR